MVVFLIKMKIQFYLSIYQSVYASYINSSRIIFAV